MEELILFGGDLRQLYAADQLIKRGYDVSLKGFELSERSLGYKRYVKPGFANKTVILPIPLEKADGTLNMPYSEEILYIRDIISELKKAKMVVGGAIKGKTKELFEENKIKYADVLADEKFSVNNARLTAEAAITSICLKTKRSLFKRNIVIAGYGRITKMLIKLLNAYGSKISILTRSEISKEWAGLSVDAYLYEEAEEALENADIIINTAPSVWLDKEKIKMLMQNAEYFELASSPYGIDFKAAEDKGIKVSILSSLPSKCVAPCAAYVLCDAILRAIKEG